MAQKPLIKTLIESGYTIIKITPATPQTMTEISLSNGLDVTGEHGLMQVGKELPDGTFRFMPIRKNVDDILNDLKEMSAKYPL